MTKRKDGRTAVHRLGESTLSIACVFVVVCDRRFISLQTVLALLSIAEPCHEGAYPPAHPHPCWSLMAYMCVLYFCFGNNRLHKYKFIMATVIVVLVYCVFISNILNLY